MNQYRQQIREFVRASETILSIQDLSPEERGAILAFIEHMTKMLPDLEKARTDGHAREGKNEGEILPDF